MSSTASTGENERHRDMEWKIVEGEDGSMRATDRKHDVVKLDMDFLVSGDNRGVLISRHT